MNNENMLKHTENMITRNKSQCPAPKREAECRHAA